MKYTPYSTAAACGALLCATVLGTAGAQAAVDGRAEAAGANLERAATAIMQNTSGTVLKIQVDGQRETANPAYDAVVDVNGRIEAMQMQGASITPVAGHLPLWADGYTPHDARELAKAKVSIGEAIDTAVKQGNGAPVGVAFMRDEYSPITAFNVALDQPMGKVLIDAKSGETIPNTAPLNLKP